MQKVVDQQSVSSRGGSLWKLPTVLAEVPVSRSAWLAGVKAGRFPAPVRLSVRSVAWRAEDVRALIASL
jgi:predicted DNA-binding transcriptional regulator AlpA